MVSSNTIALKRVKKPIMKNSKVEKPKKVVKAEKTKDNIISKKIKIISNNDNKSKNEKTTKNHLEEVETNSVSNKKEKSSKFIMPSKYITEVIVKSCLNALDQLAVCTKKKNAIFEDEQQIFVEIHCIKIQNSTGSIKFVLPHSTAASTGEVCLITPDIKKGKKIDHEPTIDRWEEILKNANVTSVKTVLPMRQLRVEYDQFELKRRLLTQHDFIMVDTRVLSHVSHILGKMFFKKHNMLIPVRLNEKDINKSIDVGLRTTMLRLSPGPTSVIVIGHTGMRKKKLRENILSLVKQLNEKYPGGEANIRSIALKLPLSMSLPLYVTLRSSNAVNAPKLNKRKPKNFCDVEDELSTIPHSKVRVAPDGTVHLKKDLQSNEDSENEPQSDEDNSAGSASEEED